MLFCKRDRRQECLATVGWWGWKHKREKVLRKGRKTDRNVERIETIRTERERQRQREREEEEDGEEERRGGRERRKRRRERGEGEREREKKKKNRKERH